MKKLTIVVALALCALFAFAACSSDSGSTASESASESASTEASSAAPAEESSAAPAEESSAAPADDAVEAAEEAVGDADYSGLIIGINEGTQTNQFHSDVVQGIINVAKDMGIETVTTVSEFDATKIIPNVQSLLDQGAQVIVDFNVNGDVGGSLVDVVKEAGGKGVIGIDVEYINSEGEYGWFMGANNQMAGELCGEAIGKYVNEYKDGDLQNLVLFYNSENGEEVKKRMGGAVDGLKKEGINLTDDQIEFIDLAGTGSDTTIEGRDKMTAWLTAHPDVTSVGVVAVNDETTTGAMAAAETVGRLEDCIFASHNVSQVYIDAALSGDLYEGFTGSVAYYPERYGEYIVPLAIDIYTGANTDPETKITVDHVFVTPDMIAEYQQGYEDYKAAWTEPLK